MEAKRQHTPVSSDDESCWSICSNEPINPADFGLLDADCGPSTYGSVSERPGTSSLKFEYGGVVVFDSKAALYTTNEASEYGVLPEPPPEPWQLYETLGEEDRKDVEAAPDCDRDTFKELPHYNPGPNYAPEYALQVPPDQNLKFNSSFESGNLGKAIKIAEDEYNLVLRFDTQTQNYTQWYYFEVTNRYEQTVKFNIINLVKYESLYNEGMKPIIWSQKKFDSTGLAWHRGGSDVHYFANRHGRATQTGLAMFTLTFKYTFEHRGDSMYFAYCYPYTYTDLMSYVESIQDQHPQILRVNCL